MATHFCDAAGSLAIACAISTRTIGNHLLGDLIFHKLEKHHKTLLRHSKISEAQVFFNLLKTTTLHLSTTYVHATITAERSCHVSRLKESFKHMIETLLIRTWKAYLTVKDQDERDLQLHAFVKSRLK
jgi:hypothetical protein